MALFGLTQKIGGAVAWLKLGSQLNNIRDLFITFKEKNGPMTTKEIALNAAKHFAYKSLALGLVAAVSYWADPATVSAFVSQHFNSALGVAAAPLIASGFTVVEKVAKNWAAGVAKDAE